MANFKIVESFQDDLKMERAFVARLHGVLLPIAIVDGVECEIHTRSSALINGIARCSPVDLGRSDDWPMYVTIDDGTGPQPQPGTTTDEDILAAARRFNELESTGRLEEGLEL